MVNESGGDVLDDALQFMPGHEIILAEEPDKKGEGS